MKTIRHWKDQYDFDAPMVFLHRMLVGGVEMVPGSPVPEELKSTLGPLRLRRWWDAKKIGLAPATVVVEEPKKRGKRKAD